MTDTINIKWEAYGRGTVKVSADQFKDCGSVEDVRAAIDEMLQDDFNFQASYEAFDLDGHIEAIWDAVRKAKRAKR
jgi:hypothetical protein